jgi:hypothetical protein
MKRNSERGLRPSVGAGSASAWARIVETGAAGYERSRHLPRVLPVGTAELTDLSREGRRRTVARLARALRAERMRGRAGHWTYDLNRHIALAQAYESERRLLERMPPS